MQPEKPNRHGGHRPGAGRKPQLEPTVPVRVPLSAADTVRSIVTRIKARQRQGQARFDPVGDILLPMANARKIALPLYSSKVPAGFPSPADEHVEQRLSPDQYLIDQEEATFFVTIQGRSMVDVGLMPGHKAVVDRSKTAELGQIVMAMVDGEFTIKILSRAPNGAPRLLPANSTGEYLPIEIKDGMQFEIWGVVTGHFGRF